VVNFVRARGRDGFSVNRYGIQRQIAVNAIHHRIVVVNNLNAVWNVGSQRRIERIIRSLRADIGGADSLAVDEERYVGADTVYKCRRSIDRDL